MIFDQICTGPSYKDTIYIISISVGTWNKTLSLRQKEKKEAALKQQ